MKTTIEISDALFAEVQKLAREEKTTFRSLTEAGLRLIMSKRRETRTKKGLPPLFTVQGNGLTEEFKNASWDDIVEEIHPLPKL
jgi:hypothetical protein